MNRLSIFICWLSLALFAAACEPTASVEETPSGPGKAFGSLGDEAYQLYSLEGEDGLAATFTDYGARMVSLKVPDQQGKARDIVLGFSEVATYAEQGGFYMGATIGRYGNRIAKGQFDLNGQGYQLAINNDPNHLHGGPEGFHAAKWTLDSLAKDFIRFQYVSPAGEENYPGTLTTLVSYQLRPGKSLEMAYQAQTTEPTIVNLTNHTYFNLNGEGSETINDHYLMVNAHQYLPVDNSLIPLGEPQSVEGTPFDFRFPTQIGARLEEEHEQLTHGNGYDHNYVVGPGPAERQRPVARVLGPDSGIMMEILTTEPGLQFYGGNWMSGQLMGKSGKPYVKRAGFCLETQHFPDSPNQADYPSVTLNPGETYRSSTMLRFGLGSPPPANPNGTR
ncbi:MAG: aldose epimerase family protein [Bacteroidota bacterium]